MSLQFGIFSNGFRPHTSAQQTYDEDISEIVLADQLGYRDCWISEHHAEPVYLGKVDVLPVPELLMCKAAAMTKQIRFGAAVKLLHLAHPVDIATLAGVTDHLTGGRYMFGFGSGVSNPIFSHERGLSFEDRYPRMLESLEFVLKCWATDEPFDWNGTYWHGKDVTVLPHPLQQPHPPMAVATDTEPTLTLAGERGYTVLAAGFDDVSVVRHKAEFYGHGAKTAGLAAPREKLTVARFIYVAGSKQEALDDLRPAVSAEMEYQKARNFFNMVLGPRMPRPQEDLAFDDLVDLGIYHVGSPDSVAESLRNYYEESGGFGTLLVTVGKSWTTHEKRARNLRLFIEEVAPKLRDLTPSG